ncbi:MAG: SAM-dependent methyltransferase [Rhodospirillaceae bacterium]|nr:SAM-dependent methyltransferase [Rhodospirillaceae bacterium]
METPIKYEDGGAYERGMGAWSQLVGKAFLNWLAPETGLRWIDIGCGTGAFTELLAQECAPGGIVGIDPAEAQLEFARERPGASSVRFHQGDAMALPFEDDSFDAAVMALVLFFVPDPSKGVAEMVRVVRPGGSVSCYVWDMHSGGFPYEPIQAEMRAIGMRPPWPPSHGISQMTSLTALWESSGLKQVHSKEIRVRRHFSDFEEFWTFSTGTGALKPTLLTMTPEKLAELKTRVRTNLKVTSDAPVTHESWANAVMGRVING